MALRMVSGMRREIELACNRTMMWDDLRACFCARSQDPGSVRCREIIAYDRWSVSEEREALPHLVQTTAVLGCLEHMVRSPERLRLLPQWLARSEILDYSWNITYAMGPIGIAEATVVFDAHERAHVRRCSAEPD